MKKYYVYDTESQGLEEESEFFWCLVFKELNKNKFHVFCDLKELSNFDQDKIGGNDDVLFYPTDYYLKLIDSVNTKGIIAHNQYGYDLPLMNKFDGVEYTYNTINGRELFIADSLVMSQVLFPDRPLPPGCPKSLPIAGTTRKKKIGPHSLDAWAYRTGISKPYIIDWQTQPLDIYLHRCIEDTKNNNAAYNMMLNEMEDVAIPNGEKIGDWKKPMRMQMRNYYLIRKQERDGACFNQELGWEILESLDKEMLEMEKDLNPLFGEKTYL